MPSSKATRRRPTSSESRATRPRRRASDFHTQSLCRMDIVPSIRNAACPQTRPNAMFSIARTYRAESGRSKIPADKATAPAMIGHLARSKPSRWGILRATDGLRSCPERHIGDRCIPPHHPLSLPAAQPHHDRRREAAVEDAPREGPHRITTPRGSGCSSSAENAPAAPASAHVIPGGARISAKGFRRGGHHAPPAFVRVTASVDSARNLGSWHPRLPTPLSLVRGKPKPTNSPRP